MPSTVPVVKPGVRDWLRTLVGLRPADGVYVSGVAVDPDSVTGDVVMLASVLAPQTIPVMYPDIREETPTVTGFCVGVRPGKGDEAEDAARDAAYALFAIVEAALKADPSAGGVIPGPLKASLTEGGLTESPGDINGSADRRATVQWRLTWTSDF
jgi:hypothetical protein